MTALGIIHANATQAPKRSNWRSVTEATATPIDTTVSASTWKISLARVQTHTLQWKQISHKATYSIHKDSSMMFSKSKSPIHYSVSLHANIVYTSHMYICMCRKIGMQGTCSLYLITESHESYHQFFQATFYFVGQT